MKSLIRQGFVYIVTVDRIKVRYDDMYTPFMLWMDKNIGKMDIEWKHYSMGNESVQYYFKNKSDAFFFETVWK